MTLVMEAAMVLTLLGLTWPVLALRQLVGYLALTAVASGALLLGCLIYLLIRSLGEKHILPATVVRPRHPVGVVD